MSVTIQSGIPIPPTKRPGTAGAGRPAKWPWQLMEVGDSFFAKGYCAQDRVKSPAGFVMRITGGRSLVPGSQWAVRDVVENGVRGVRVWRTA